jgi:hypothetical protein
MNDTLNAWGLHSTAELTRHICESVAPLMPDGLRVLAGGLDVLLEKTSPGGAPRVVSSFQIQPPVDFEATPLRVVAHHILTDLQDEIALYLHEPWPGAALHPSVEENGPLIELAFRSDAPDNSAYSLPPFKVPPKPEGTVHIG